MTLSIQIAKFKSISFESRFTKFNAHQSFPLYDTSDVGQVKVHLLYTCHCRTQIVENFIPPEEAEKITERAFYDQDMDEWQLKPLKPPAR